MRSGMMTIFKKELARFFGDRRMIFSTILLPGLMIYLLYSVMGSAITNKFSVDEAVLPSVAVFGTCGEVQPMLAQAVVTVDFDSQEDAEEAVRAQTLDAVLVFPEDFDAQVEAYTVGAGNATNVEIYYNSASSQ